MENSKKLSVEVENTEKSFLCPECGEMREVELDDCDVDENNNEYKYLKCPCGTTWTEIFTYVGKIDIKRVKNEK
jgi:predicted RNA-binding Zn-ribbon protein involved in translation (DUF1610 family)